MMEPHSDLVVNGVVEDKVIPFLNLLNMETLMYPFDKLI